MKEVFMIRINKIESAIKELEGGRFQNLGDAYLRKKYHFEKLVSFGFFQKIGKKQMICFLSSCFEFSKGL